LRKAFAFPKSSSRVEATTLYLRHSLED